MNTTSVNITIRGIDVDVVYKDIKNLHVAVYPPLGRVRVSAPRQLDDDQIRRAVIHRLPWIKKQREELRSAERQSQREMVTGESHYVWGVRHRLEVIQRPGRPKVEFDAKRLLISSPRKTTVRQRRELLDRWYRQELRSVLPALIVKWESILGVSVPRWSIRRMKTKWGSCNRKTGHIWFNVELAKKHPHCVEYIVMHEMTHLVERNHGERFKALISEVMPQWRRHRDLLNSSPLAHEDWSY